MGTQDPCSSWRSLRSAAQPS